MNTEIIYDDPRTTNLRFETAIPIRFISTRDVELKDTRGGYNIQKLTCCSPVKDTKENWFYALSSDVSLSKLQLWLDEFSSLFPALDIRIIKSSCKTTDGDLCSSNEYIKLHYTNGDPFSMVLRLSDESSNYYSYSNNKRFPTAHFTHITFLVELFVDYCSENKIKLTQDSFEKEIKTFVSENILDIQEEFTRHYIIKVYCEGFRHNMYNVDTQCIVDPLSVTADVVIPYLRSVIYLNLHDVIRLIANKIQGAQVIEREGAPYIQALYSKKSYRVEAYLAHHLIRAGLAEAFKPFIAQYYLIKKSLPKEYFWNLIFLTQFGFNFYYYYWLTGERNFKLTTPEKFLQHAKNFNESSSSLKFFEKFAYAINSASKDRLIKLYKEGKFVELASLLRSSLKVAVKDSSKKRLHNLRIAENYNVMYSENDYYYVKGDDFRIHKYLKKNFIEIREAV